MKWKLGIFGVCCLCCFVFLPWAAPAKSQENRILDKIRSLISFPPEASTTYPCTLNPKTDFEGDFSNAELDLATAQMHTEQLEQSLLFLKKALLRHHTSTPQTHVLTRMEQRVKRAIRKTSQLQKKLAHKLQQVRTCTFLTQLNMLLKAKHTTPTSRSILQNLRSLAQKLASSPERQWLMHKRATMKLFERVYRLYWPKKQLDNASCRVLEKTYEIWSSFYNAENQQNAQIGPRERNLPIYYGNGHNSSYKYWAAEARKGRLPKQGATLIHPDSHPDMGGFQDHSPNHWSHRVLPLRQINEVLAQKDDKAFRQTLLSKLRTAQHPSLSGLYKRAVRAIVQERSVATLRRELHQQIRARVHNIAHPLTAASYAGILNKLILCMPPWSERLERSSLNKAGKSIGFPISLIRENKNETIYFGISKTQSKLPFIANSSLPPLLVFEPQKSTYSPLPQKLQFHVAECNRENQIDPSGKDPGIQLDKDKQLHSFDRYFSRQKEGKHGFILGFDLDVFSTDGTHGDYLIVPRSFARHTPQIAHPFQTKHILKNPQHIAVSKLEVRLVKLRLRSFFQRLRTTKEKGYTPSMVSFADSTGLQRVFQGTLHPDELGGGTYTPGCLVYLIHFHIRKQLAKLYPFRSLYIPTSKPSTSKPSTSQPTSQPNAPTSQPQTQ